MATYLDRIGAWHRERAARDGRDVSRLAAAARRSGPVRDLEGALRALAGTDRRVALIAEIKRRSPSRGDIDPHLDPSQVAVEYAEGGAAAVSVLTDGPHFSGSAKDLEAARAAVDLPVLRKDFTVSKADVYDARLMGADGLLLIAALLDDGELALFSEIAAELSMAALVEVHDEAELERALDLGARLIGINQRDLHSFEVERDRAVRLASGIPAGTVKVAESGIETAEDVAALGGAGFDAVLVGESLLRAPDRRAAAARLSGRTVPCG